MNAGLPPITMTSLWVLFLDEFTTKGNRTGTAKTFFLVYVILPIQKGKNMPEDKVFCRDCLGFGLSNTAPNPSPSSFLVNKRFRINALYVNVWPV